MCEKRAQLLDSCHQSTSRDFSAHRRAMPQSLGKQGYDRGKRAPHIAALYLAIDFSPVSGPSPLPSAA